MAAKSSVPTFSTLKECLQFLEWLKTRIDMQLLVVSELANNLSDKYINANQDEIKRALTQFLNNVNTFYKRLCYNATPGIYRGGKTATEIANTFIVCIPKFLAVMYFLRYNVDEKFGAVGGGGWKDLYPGYGGDLDNYLVAAAKGNIYGSVIPGGFKKSEIKYGSSGYYKGLNMASDLEKICEKGENQKFRDVFVTSVSLTNTGVEISNAANVLALVSTLCQIVVSQVDPDGGEVKKKLDANLKTKGGESRNEKCICWRELKTHCESLQSAFSKIFNTGRFSFTGYKRGSDKLHEAEFAKNTADWLRTNLPKVRNNFLKIQHFSSKYRRLTTSQFMSSTILPETYQTEFAEYFTKHLFPYGFTFERYNFGTASSPYEVLTDNWYGVIEMLRQSGDGGLDKLVEILDGKNCRPQNGEERDDKESAKNAQKTEATKTEAAKPVVTRAEDGERTPNQGKKAEGAQNQGKKAEGSSDQVNGQSDRKVANSESPSSGAHDHSSGRRQNGQAVSSDAAQSRNQAAQKGSSGSNTGSSAGPGGSGGGSTISPELQKRFNDYYEEQRKIKTQREMELGRITNPLKEKLHNIWQDVQEKRIKETFRPPNSQNVQLQDIPTQQNENVVNTRGHSSQPTHHLPNLRVPTSPRLDGFAPTNEMQWKQWQWWQPEILYPQIGGEPVPNITQSPSEKLQLHLDTKYNYDDYIKDQHEIETIDLIKQEDEVKKRTSALLKVIGEDAKQKTVMQGVEEEIVSQPSFPALKPQGAIDVSNFVRKAATPKVWLEITRSPSRNNADIMNPLIIDAHDPSEPDVYGDVVDDLNGKEVSGRNGIEEVPDVINSVVFSVDGKAMVNNEEPEGIGIRDSTPLDGQALRYDRNISGQHHNIEPIQAAYQKLYERQLRNVSLNGTPTADSKGIPRSMPLQAPAFNGIPMGHPIKSVKTKTEPSPNPRVLELTGQEVPDFNLKYPWFPPPPIVTSPPSQSQPGEPYAQTSTQNDHALTNIPANLRFANAFMPKAEGNPILEPDLHSSPIPTEYLQPPPPGGMEIADAYIPRKIPDQFEIDIHVPKLKLPDNNLNFDLTFDNDSTHIKTETLPDPVDPPFPAVSFNIAPPDVEQSMPPPKDFDKKTIKQPDIELCIAPWATSTPAPGSPDIPETELFPSQAPRTVREMLQWLAGLKHEKHHKTLKQCINNAFGGPHSDPSQLALSVNGSHIIPQHLLDTIHLTAMFAGSVLSAIAPNWKASVSSKSVQPKPSGQSDERDCCAHVYQLRDYVYACHHQLEFLKSQCSRNEVHGGWQDSKYGSDIKTSSPLQSFLIDGWDSTFETHLFDPCNLCHKSRIRMGFRDSDLPSGQQTGSIISTILTPSCGGEEHGALVNTEL